MEELCFLESIFDIGAKRAKTTSSTKPLLSPQRILFTPNFAAKVEYEYALKAGVFVTIDNATLLRDWTATFANAQILLRVDPGTGHGHHDHVKTVYQNLEKKCGRRFIFQL